MTYYPKGDPDGSDPYPGSLFVAGNDSEDPYGSWRACWIAEISIPTPVIPSDKDASTLPTAVLLQDFVDLRGDKLYGPKVFFELPKVGIQYVPAQGSQTTDMLYLAWGQHIENEDAPTGCQSGTDPSCVPSHSARPLGPNGQLTHAETLGPWWIEGGLLYSVNDYLFEIPLEWAKAHVGGRAIATGRFRDGGQGSQGPVLIAIGPWLDGNPPAAKATLSAVTLLHYSSFPETDRRLTGYQHSDEWNGGAWITTSSRRAVIFVGSKSAGPQYWYGWQHCPQGKIPCVEPESVGGPGCFNADGTPCHLSPAYYCQCTESSCDENCFGNRGWWSQRWESRILLYDPADLERVASGQMKPDEPQPYAYVVVDDILFLKTPAGSEGIMGVGQQRRYRLGAVAYDPKNHLLYVTEQHADIENEQPIIHVWSVRD